MFWETMFKLPEKEKEQILFTVNLPKEEFINLGWKLNGEPISVYMNSEKLIIKKK